MNFYTDAELKKLKITIPRETVIAINKRQINRNDVFKFSIYYQLPNSKEIKEIKLKASSRLDTDRWISTLRKCINPKKYEFKYVKNNQENANLLFPFSDTRKLYLSLCHIEYIMNREKMMQFFEYYFDKKNGGNGENDYNNNNNSSILGTQEFADDKDIKIELKPLN